jgi:ubiquinone biosynthesis protein UbiJ
MNLFTVSAKLNPSSLFTLHVNKTIHIILTDISQSIYLRVHHSGLLLTPKQTSSELTIHIPSSAVHIVERQINISLLDIKGDKKFAQELNNWFKHYPEFLVDSLACILPKTCYATLVYQAKLSSNCKYILKHALNSIGQHIAFEVGALATQHECHTLFEDTIQLYQQVINLKSQQKSCKKLDDS